MKDLRPRGRRLLRLVALAVAAIGLTCVPQHRHEAAGETLPVVYSDHYNITLLGFQKLHPFDSEKYSRAFLYLRNHAGLSEACVYEPSRASDAELLSVHTTEYLESLAQSGNVAAISEMGVLRWVPSFIVRKRILDPMRYAVGGTVLAARLAMARGWAVNLSGGYHHAKPGAGGGFCFFADVPIAAHALWAQQPDLRVMVVDLDAHQGNGNEICFGDDPRAFLYDLYNQAVYPGDAEAKRFIDFDIPVPPGIGDQEYLDILRQSLAPAVDQAKPGIIFYNAGTDVFREDPLGGMALSEEGIIKRDELVFRCARERGIPIAMVLSGGYTKQSAAIIGRSVENILKNLVGEVPAAGGPGKPDGERPAGHS